MKNEMTKTESVMVNGVDVKRLHETIEAIKAQPTLGKFIFRNKNTWMDGGHNRSTIKEFYGAGQEDSTRTKAHVMDNDEPQILLGRDLAANPVEYVLHALAGCLTSTLVYYAAAKGIEIEELETTYKGYIDVQGFLGLNKDVPVGYEKIDVMFRIKANCSDEQLMELVQLAQMRSPVNNTLVNPVAVSAMMERIS